MDSMERFFNACRCLDVDRPPVWLMRQAGRYLPEYRQSRALNDFLTTCHTPSLAADVTLMPLLRYPLDAGIIFSDILVVPEAIGCRVTYPKGGPEVEPMVASAGDLEALRVPDVEKDLGFVGEAIREVKKRLPRPLPMLGFAGAPFTLACYMTPSPARERSYGPRIIMKKDPSLYAALMERLTSAVIDFLLLQIRGGADAVQLFDTWAGELSARDYETFVLPWHVKIMEAVKTAGVPRILYVNGVANVLELMAQSGADVISVDWRIDLCEARRRIGPRIALQGNLDPLLLFASPEKIREEVRRVHESLGAKGHIFNLGHGILPGTPVEGPEALAAAVMELAR
jgi:uroporphyrinogen decarboxylase